MIDEQCMKLNRRALFADETADYRMPEEPDTGESVILRFRAARGGVDRVFYVEDTEDTEQYPNGYQEVRMARVAADRLFEYYQCVRPVGEKVIRYSFRAERNDEICYYNRLGAVDEYQREYCFRITPGFHVPDWAKGAVMYQIFIDRFCNGDKSNDVQDCEYVYIGRPVTHTDEWSRLPSTLDVGCFYGGDLQGVWDKLDYLQDLGVEVIYFNPIFVSPSNHKYDAQDYDHIDPHYGVIVKDEGELVKADASTNEHATRYQTRSADPENLEASDRFFARFMKEVHRRGMKVIIDGVFNHCGSFNKWLDRERFYERQGSYEPGAYVSKESPYHTFFKFYKDKWPDNDSYDSWWGNDTLPKLNYEDSPKLYDYIMSIARKWVSEPYCVDGWRLDVAADLGHSGEYNHRFWRDFRRNVKEANPNAIILAEHYGDPRSWLEGDQWDTVMNYDAFMEPLTWFLTGMEKHSDEYNGVLYGNGESFFQSMFFHMSRMQTQSLMVAMNQLSNHDHSRFLTRTNQIVGRIATAGADMASFNVNRAVLREAALVQMTWPGAPTLYYGDETGVCGWTDPDSRRSYPWAKQDFELIEYHRYLIRLHKELPALRRGSVKQLCAEQHVIAYGRMCGDNKCVVAVNNRREECEIHVPVWELGFLDHMPLYRVMLTHASGYNAGRVEYHSRSGVLKLTLPPTSGVLLTTGDRI